jgi:hypothetical protein
MSLQSHLMVAVGFVRQHDKCKTEKPKEIAVEKSQTHECIPLGYFEDGFPKYKCAICFTKIK